MGSGMGVLRCLTPFFDAMPGPGSTGTRCDPSAREKGSVPFLAGQGDAGGCHRHRVLQRVAPCVKG